MDFQQFTALGDSIRAVYKDANFNEALFPEIAATSLAQAELKTDFDLGSVADFLVSTNIAQQPGLRFSNLPPIVYRCQEFYIEMLVWMDATTSIHQHAFSGAFRVLKGSSLHSTYDFHEHERISSRLLIGEARFKECSVLKAGDVQPIHSGREGLLHALFHLEQPSITLVVRTKSDPWARPQYALSLPNIAYASADLARDPTILLLGQVLEVAQGLDRQHCADLFVEKVSQLDFPRLFSMYQAYNHTLRTEADLDRFMEKARVHHGALVDHLTPLRAASARANSLIQSRKSVKDSDLRFFLALLMNLPDRAAILKMIAQEYPNQKSEELCVQWLKRLSAEESASTAFLALAQQAKLGSDRFGTKLKTALACDPKDPTADALFHALAAGTLSGSGKQGEGLLQMDELAPLLR